MAEHPSEQRMLDMVTRVMDEPWSTHVVGSCSKCQKCNCGKHKCQIRAPKLAMSPQTTTYNESFHKRRAITHSQPHMKNLAEVRLYVPDTIVAASHYHQEFENKSTQFQSAKVRPHQNNLELGGPTFSKTTYQNTFTPAKGPATEPIKNPQTLGLLSGAKMNSVTNYRQTYKWYVKERAKPIKRADNLRTEPTTFTGTSNYRDNYLGFKNFKREKSFAPERVYSQTRGLKTESSYNKDYQQRNPEVCPATRT